MLMMTTTPTVEGKPVKDYLGIVSGETILLGDIFSGLSGIEKVFLDARHLALAKLSAQAAALGANAIVGVSFDYELAGVARMVFATGTAVLLPSTE